MTNAQIIQILLASTVVAGLVSALIGGIFASRLKQQEYRNEYYKLVLQKRIAAYEAIDEVILQLKHAVHGDDGKLYHLLFSDQERVGEVYALIAKTSVASIWLSDSMYKLLRDLNVMIFENDIDNDVIAFGKANYVKIGHLRSAIERQYCADMAKLHHVPRFLKSKKFSDSYTPIQAPMGRVPR